MPIEPKSTVAVVLDNGTQVTTQCISNPQEVEDAYNRAVKEGGRVRLQTGDDTQMVIFLIANKCALFSVRNFIDEKKAAKEAGDNGLILPPRRIISREH